MALKVAIIGKPNVGKSTLFNRLCRKKLAITHDRPGVTRDAKSYLTSLGQTNFEVIDTAGLDFNKDALTQKMMSSAVQQAKMADIIFFVIDGKNGINVDDFKFVDLIRKLSKDVLLIINKCEGKHSLDYKEISRFGFGEPILISAEHGLGLNMLEESLTQLIEEKNYQLEVDPDIKEIKTIRLCILGRPNAGKSTLFNRLLGFEKSIVFEDAGTTRDAISHNFEYEGTHFELIDTAGLRKKAKVQDSVECLSTAESINALRRANVVLMVVDATLALQKQDLSILRVAINEGKAVVLVVNKRDLITDQKLYLKELEQFVERYLYEIKEAPVVFISAKNDESFEQIFKQVAFVEKNWQSRISTTLLNRWVNAATEKYIPPLSKSNRRIKFKYITQTGVKPPTFTMFCNISAALPGSYTRYLYNSLREAFKLYGTPIRIRYRQSNNPYRPSS